MILSGGYSFHWIQLFVVAINKRVYQPSRHSNHSLLLTDVFLNPKPCWRILCVAFFFIWMIIVSFLLSALTKLEKKGCLLNSILFYIHLVDSFGHKILHCVEHSSKGRLFENFYIMIELWSCLWWNMRTSISY